MPGGRPRKPLALKVLSGTVEKSRLQKNAPRPDASALPPPPPHFSDRDKWAWRELAKVLDPMRVATNADLVAFGSMARIYSLLNQAHEELRTGKDQKLTEKTAFGKKRREEVNLVIAFDKALRDWIGRFGLDPVSREKVSARAAEAKDDPLDEFAVGGNRGA